MGTKRLRLFSNLRRRLGFELGRPWRSRELVHVPFQMRTITGDGAADGQELGDDSRDLVSLLGWSDGAEWRDGTHHRPRTFTYSTPRTESRTWSMAGQGGACPDCTTRYGHPILDCE